MTSAAEIDTTKPFRSVPRLVELVRYVVATSPDNETDWIEWKCGLDLTKPAGRFAVAKQIIGFANRDPRRAATHADGCAFMVLGAEPGNLAGQPGMDPSKVESAIRPYVGTDGPDWAPQTVNVDGADVVVITVEPPRWGNPIHTLRKEYWAEDGSGAKDGDVFIRRPGGSHPASSGEHQMLQRRLLSRPAEGLEVVVESVGQPIPRVDVSDDAVDAWLADERMRLLAPLEAAERERVARESPVSVTRPLTPEERRVFGAAIPALEEFRRNAQRFASIQASARDILGPTRINEDRNPDDYRAEVEAHLDAARPLARTAALDRFERVVDVRLALRAVNTDDRNLESVEVVVYFPGPVFWHERRDVALPVAPRPWGPRSNPRHPFYLATVPPVTVASRAMPWAWESPGYTARNTGSTTIEFEPFDLRPHKEYDLPDVPLVVSAELAGSITGSWTATATNRDGRARGSVTVVLADVVVSVGDLLD